MSKSSAKVQAIYDNIDCHNEKQAIKLCDQLLKKKPSSLVKALKALALTRMNRTEDALDLCREVQKDKPTDETILKTLFHCYKAMNKMEEMADVYATALDVDPRNEEMAQQLFFHTVRTHLWRDAQQVALAKLYKMHKKRHYMFWSITCMTCQVGTVGPSPVLNLAAMMLKKQADAGNLLEYEELLLYIMTLERQEKWSEALAVVEEFHSLFKVATDRLRASGSLQLKLGQFEGARDTYLALVQDHNPDNWEFIDGYIQASIGLSTEEAAAAGAVMKELQAKNPVLRGPWLGEIDIAVRCEHADIVAPLLLEYFKRFGGKTICFNDMRRYLDALATDGGVRAAFIDSLVASLPEVGEEDDVKAGQDRARRLSCIAGLERALGLHPPAGEDAASKAASLLADFQAVLPLGTELARGERQFGDDQLLLAVHILLDLHAASGEDQLLLECLVLLRYALELSPFNFQFMLTAVELYVKIGAFLPLSTLYPKLELKHIQHDTLTHFVVPHVARMGHPEDAVAMCEEIAYFYQSANNDTPDWMATTFRDSTYSKTMEFANFHHKIINSSQRTISLAAAAWLHATTKLNSVDAARVYFMDAQRLDTSDEFYAAMTFTQDYEAQSDWSPPEAREARLVGKRGARDLAVEEAKARRLALAALAGLLDVAHDRGDLSVSRDEVERLHVLVESMACEDASMKASWTAVSHALGAVVAAAEVKALQGKDGEQEAACGRLVSALSATCEAVAGGTDELPSTLPLRMWTSVLSLLEDGMAWALFCMHLAAKLLPGPQGGKKKKKKAAKMTPAVAGAREKLKDSAEALATLLPLPLAALEAAHASTPEDLFSGYTPTIPFLTMEGSAAHRSSLAADLMDNRRGVLKRAREVTRGKLAFAASLKL